MSASSVPDAVCVDFTIHFDGIAPASDHTMYEIKANQIIIWERKTKRNSMAERQADQ